MVKGTNFPIAPTVLSPVLADGWAVGAFQRSGKYLLFSSCVDQRIVQKVVGHEELL